MPVQLERLQAELRAAGLPVLGVAVVKAPHETAGPATFVARPGDGRHVRVDWTQAPSAPQAAQAASLVGAHDGTRTLEERLDDAGRFPGRLLAALTLRASTQWTSLSAAQRQRAMAVIDAAAADVIAKLS